VETPIIEQVHAMLYEGKGPKEALKELMTRVRRGED
jgi:glycerol-3-phosphate dehydrogenase